jgi:plasmid maintenance system killer protein
LTQCSTMPLTFRVNCFTGAALKIHFDDSKLQKACNNSRLLKKQHGEKRAKRIRRRLDDLLAAESLEDMRPPWPGRCHELTGNRKGEFSLDLDHPYRLIFVPDHYPISLKPDGGIDWKEITSVLITGVEDTHD